MKVRSLRAVIVLLVVLLIVFSGFFAFPASAQGSTTTVSSFTNGQCGGAGNICAVWDNATPTVGQTVNVSGVTFSPGGYVAHVSFSPCVMVDINETGHNPFPENIHHYFDCDTTYHDLSGSGSIEDVPSNVWISGFGLGEQTSFNVAVTILAIQGYSTPTPTPSPTPTILPPTSSGITLSSCPLLGQANSNFQNLPGNWLLAPTTLANPTGTTAGLAFTTTNANAQLPLTVLNRLKQYIITVKYHITNTTPGSISLGLGNSPLITVPIAGTADTVQTFETLAANFEPNRLGFGTTSDRYNLILIAPTTDDLIIDYICVKESTTSTGNNTNGGVTLGVGGTSGSYAGVHADINSATCAVDDSNVFSRAISILWNCGIKIGFERVLAWSANMLHFVQVGIAWLGQTVTVWWTWLIDTLGVLWAWIAGAGGNILTIVFNAAADVFNRLGLSNLFNNLIAFLSHLPQFISEVAATAGAAISIIGYWIGRIINTVLNVIFAVPMLISSLVTGINTSASTVPIYAPDCNSNNPVLYAPCLSFYVLDNTVWDGPAFFIMPVFLGLIAWQTVGWALNAVKETFSK
jgi:hypothetical protein